MRIQWIRYTIFRQSHCEIGKKTNSIISCFWLFQYAPWCWNIYQHLHHKSPSVVGTHTIHGAYGILIIPLAINPIPDHFKISNLSQKTNKRDMAKMQKTWGNGKHYFGTIDFLGFLGWDDPLTASMVPWLRYRGHSAGPDVVDATGGD